MIDLIASHVGRRSLSVCRGEFNLFIKIPSIPVVFGDR